MDFGLCERMGIPPLAIPLWRIPDPKLHFPVFVHGIGLYPRRHVARILLEYAVLDRGFGLCVVGDFSHAKPKKAGDNTIGALDERLICSRFSWQSWLFGGSV